MVCTKATGKLYRIVVRREIGDRFVSAFEGMHMEMRDGRTTHSGEVKDQPHLFGILERINGLGLELLSVEALPEDARPSIERDRVPKLENPHPAIALGAATT